MSAGKQIVSALMVFIVSIVILAGVISQSSLSDHLSALADFNVEKGALKSALAVSENKEQTIGTHNSDSHTAEDMGSAHPARQYQVTRWRGNQYVNEDGILPWQRCNTTESESRIRPIETRFKHRNRMYAMVITAASVWGRSKDDTGKPVSMDRIEFLMYLKFADSVCSRDAGNHCCFNIMQEGSSRDYTHGCLPRVTCDVFGDGKLVEGHVVEARKYMDYGDSFAYEQCTSLYTIECPYPYERMLSLEHVNTVRLRIGNQGPDATVVKVDLCYLHVKKVFPLTICTQPLYGFSMNNSFWTGIPKRFPGGKSLMDYFLMHHIKSLSGTRIVVHDVMDSFREIVTKYKNFVHEDSVVYRSHVASEMSQFEAGLVSMLHGDAYSWAFEPLLESTCMWEHRLNSRMVMVVHSPDNFVMPGIKNKSPGNFSDTLWKLRYSSILVPVVQAHTPLHPKQEGGNIFRQWSLLGNDLEFGHGRHTPVANPRHFLSNYVHWNPSWYVGKFRGEIGYRDAVNMYGFHTVHIMAMTRPSMDKHEGREDAAYNYFAELLDEA